MMLRSILLMASAATVMSQDLLIDPRTRFQESNLSFPADNSYPVLQSSFETPPDCGEESYAGNGRLEGRKAIITGGDSGIGRAVAIAYAREGAQVVINYLPEEEPDAQQVDDLFTEEGLHLIRIPGDLTNETFCKDLVEESVRQMGGLDIVVNNAAYGGYQSGSQYRNISEHSTEQLERIFRTNVFAPFFVSRAAVPHLPPGASILFTLSSVASNPQPNALDYSASKGALANLVGGLAGQLAALGIRVNGIAPGVVYSPFPVANGDTLEGFSAFADTLPAGRLGQPAELAPLYVQMADDETSYTTGSIWAAHGGQSGSY